MLLSIVADERAALAFEDVASALDAGLPLQALGGDPAAGERTLHGILARRSVRLDDTEGVVLLHAWRAGKAPAALRARAAARRQRADYTRTLWSGLRYPLLLAGMLLLASIATMSLIGPGLLIGLCGIYAVLAGAAVWLRWAMRRGNRRIGELPLIGKLVTGLAEIPYLETLGALYGAGVPLNQAHTAAVATVPAGAVKQRLQIADAIVQGGQPLREALAQSLALHTETRSLLTTGEHAGHLEESLQRALVRRRDVTSRGIAGALRLAGQIAYAFAVIGVVYIVVRFYSSYFASLKF